MLYQSLHGQIKINQTLHYLSLPYNIMSNLIPEYVKHEYSERIKYIFHYLMTEYDT